MLLGCQVVAPETVTRTNSVAVPSTYTIEVDTFNGAIEVVRGATSTVDVVATIHQPDDVDYNVELDGDTLRITAVAGRTHITPSPGASIRITAPPSANLDLNTSNGSIDVTDVGTGGRLETSNGLVHLEQVEGHFELHSSNGRIEMTNVSGSFDASTSNGRIEFDGSLEDGTSSELQTSNGSIEAVVGTDANIRLDADTSNGQVHVAYPLNDAQIDKDHVVGTLGTGASSLTLRTSNGDIDVR